MSVAHRDHPPALSDPLGVFARRHGHVDAETAMRQLCDELRRASGQVDPPVGVERGMLELLRAYKVRAKGKQSASGPAAQLRVVAGRYEVELGDQFWRRRRFTVAHEICHMLVLDTLADDVAALQGLRSSTVMPELEKLCNEGAAELLMPRDWLAEDVRGLRFEGASLSWLHGRYLVSWSALLRRLTELWPDSTISVWNRRQRAEDSPDLFRLVHSYGGMSPRWLPRGLSERSISTPLLTEAAISGQSSCGRLTARFGGRETSAGALATTLPAGAPGSVALILLPDDAETLWRSLQGSLQLQLSLNEPQPPLAVDAGHRVSLVA